MSKSSDAQRHFRCYGKRHSLSVALLCACGILPSAAVLGQPYMRYDGSRTTDLSGALSSWTDAAEFTSDWGLGAMKAQHAYARGLSGAGVRLGAVDSGFLASHQEFATRGVRALQVKGRYRDVGSQLDGGGMSWRAGEAFDVPGVHQPQADLARHVGKNDNHGNHVSGTIAAARNGVGMMGVAFGSRYAIANSNGTDASRYGSNMDYNYFHAAYDAVAASGARAINSSWGSPADVDDYGSVQSFTEAYARLEGAGKKTWLDAAADVAQAHGVLHVWANGNAGAANPSVRAGLPYFRPEVESKWIAVTTVDEQGGTHFNRCGVGKYWCLAAPGMRINSASLQGNDKYEIESGTSMSAPHVTGALGLLMERYPYLDTEAVRTILLSTASHRGDSSAGLPDATFGWGVPDLERALEGPAQLLGRFVADVPAGVSDAWRNGVSDMALKQRRVEEAAELAAWPAERERLQAAVKPVPPLVAPTAELVAGMAAGRKLLAAATESLVHETFSYTRYMDAITALFADPAGRALAALYGAAHPRWETRYGPAGAGEAFVAGRTDAALASAAMNVKRDVALAYNAGVPAMVEARDARIEALRAKTAADYEVRFIKRGAGMLALQGDSGYTGPTIVDGGELRIIGSIVSPTTVHAGGTLVVNGRSGDVAVSGGRASLDGQSAAVVVAGGGLLEGDGTLARLHAGAGGIVAPGHSIGTLHVSGDAVFTPGSVYAVELAQDASDRIEAGGQASLSGGTLALGLASGARGTGLASLLGRRYAVLLAHAGVRGRFDGVQAPSVFVDGRLGYEANRVTLALARNRTSFASLAETGNQRRLAAAIETAGTPGVYERVLDARARVDAVAAYRALSGDIYPALASAAIEESRLLRDAMAGRMDPARLRSLRAGQQAAGGWGQWLGAHTYVRGDGEADGYGSRTDGFLLGADGDLHGTRVGVVAGYGRGSVHAANRPASAKVEAYDFGIYAGRQVGPWGWRAGATYGARHADVRRAVRFADLADASAADVRGTVMQIFAQAGWRAVDTERTLLEPYAGLAWVHACERGFVESGGASALRGRRASHLAAFATVGLRGEVRLAFDARRQLSVRGGLSWRHALGDTAPRTTLAFASTPTRSRFTVRSPTLARDAAVVDLKATLSIGANASAGLAYSALLAGSTHSQAVHAEVAWRF
ncbi:hypothetical protein CEG14_18040 [Bordetella genomosp. 1]|uniref:Autotransporter domain-containing protein n=1 Tax=Bordetella genomosp. 1 TaxID=1395607 RepID=A0A261S735_9BORD|nr:autotransporter domain-containing protein [Bordetella genomosp. 1]OZI32792.1 hypothetical protein CEG14_18040 [Bordetella genomosp. 1]